MRTSNLKAIVLSLAVLVPAAAVADVDFTRYVALGDSLTAGFQSGGLAVSGQMGSYPRWIHFAATGNDQFEQPLVSNPGLPPQLQLASLVPLVISPKPGLGNPLNLQLPRPYDNLGIPGSLVHDTLNTVTDNGGLHDLILRGFGTAAQEALSLHPTFITLWIGNNDALGAATSGIVIDGVTITPTASFEADYRALVDFLSQSGAKMAFATIPRVTSIPFVATIPPFVVDPATQQPVLINGQTIPLIGPNGPLGPGDRVLLTAQTELSEGKGIPAQLGGCGCPLSDSSVLDAGEVAAVQSHIDAYNAVIRDVANAKGAALVDAAAIFDSIVGNGIDVGGIQITADFLTGGLFSYDGVHPSPFGYAFIAEQFVQAINAKYGASIPDVNFRRALYNGSPATTAPVSAAQAAGAFWSDRADANLRWMLHIPPKDVLEAMDAALHPGSGGGDTGGDNGGGGGGGGGNGGGGGGGGGGNGGGGGGGGGGNHGGGGGGGNGGGGGQAGGGDQHPDHRGGGEG